NSQTDHALRAVRAALLMRHEVQALHERLPEAQRLQFGIGIHTGSAVLGNVGGVERREFSAIGEAWDVARLLQENAARGEILLSAATYEQVKEDVECELLAPRKTRDREDFTAMYRVNG
ncbi:MAG: adenylate/guanylate cyclase domain-containing protein, partial [Anaerolineae bacterium]|nr:adenylate/guanylate cyclase domain-containing protein [Anaerolineae bacterium]